MTGGEWASIIAAIAGVVAAVNLTKTIEAVVKGLQARDERQSVKLRAEVASLRATLGRRAMASGLIEEAARDGDSCAWRMIEAILEEGQPAILAIVRPSGDIVASTGWAFWLGHRDVAGTRWCKMVPPAEENRVVGLLAQAFERRSFAAVDGIVLRSNGRGVRVRWWGCAVDGHVLVGGVLGATLSGEPGGGAA